MSDHVVNINGKEIVITEPDQVLWPDIGITKAEYIQYLIEVSSYLLAYAYDRMAMLWIYPHGIHRAKIEKRSVPDSAPEWICQTLYKGKQRILLNDLETLVWAANYGAQELHVPFDRIDRMDYPTELFFDLDPMDVNDFDQVRAIALELKTILDSLGLMSVAKTSGGSGLHVSVPIEPRYTFEETRKISTFIAEFIKEKRPGDITLERAVHKRGKKLYFDYLQLWAGRTMSAPYSVRARANATVSAPVTWEEVADMFHPNNFTISSIPHRLREKGDLFAPVTVEKRTQNLNEILSFVARHKR